MMQAGYKIWPLVTLLNLTIVPLESRILVGNLVGVLWGIYFNLAFALSGSS
jgi:protein Mpv17